MTHTNEAQGLLDCAQTIGPWHEAFVVYALLCTALFSFVLGAWLISQCVDTLAFRAGEVAGWRQARREREE